MNCLDFQLKRSRTYFNETNHSYSLPAPHDIDDISEVMSSKVKVTDKFSGSPSKTF